MCLQFSHKEFKSNSISKFPMREDLESVWQGAFFTRTQRNSAHLKYPGKFIELNELLYFLEICLMTYHCIVLRIFNSLLFTYKFENRILQLLGLSSYFFFEVFFFGVFRQEMATWLNLFWFAGF